MNTDFAENTRAELGRIVRAVPSHARRQRAAQAWFNERCYFLIGKGQVRRRPSCVFCGLRSVPNAACALPDLAETI